jgi:hypothetical protein
MLHWGASNWATMVFIGAVGMPMGGVSVVSYQFVAEVTYPVSEVQGVSLMNTFNKLLTFAMVRVIQ